MIQTDELSAVVYQHIIEHAPDSLARQTGFMNYLVKEGKKHQNGGVNIQFPQKLIENASSGFIPGVGAVTSVTPSPQLQYGVLDWKYYYYHVNFTLQDFTVARGESEALDFMEAKTEGALDDSSREISLAMHGSSTTNPLNPEGLEDITAASGTAYGGLLDTDYATGAFLPIITTDTLVNFTNVNKMITELQGRMRGGLNNKQMIGLMNQAVYGRYKASVQNQFVFIDHSSGILKTGFKGFDVNGIEFHLDADCPGTQDGTADNHVYIFPTDIMKMYYCYGFGKASPLDGRTKMPAEPLMSAQHYMAFNLVCNNRRLIAVNKTFEA